MYVNNIIKPHLTDHISKLAERTSIATNLEMYGSVTIFPEMSGYLDNIKDTFVSLGTPHKGNPKWMANGLSVPEPKSKIPELPAILEDRECGSGELQRLSRALR